MQRYIFDIVLITLAVVVLLHLVFNNSLFASDKNDAEHMRGVSNKSNLNSKSNVNYETVFKLKPYDDGEYRDPGTSGLDRTDSTKEWYHVANKLVGSDNSVDSDNKKEEDFTLFGVTFGNSKSASDSDSNSDSDSVDADYAKLVDILHSDNSKSNNLKTERKAIKQGRLVIGDNYEGRMTSDPIDAGQQKRPPTFGDRPRYSEEVLHACIIEDQDALEMKRYIRDYVLDGKEQCGCVPDKSKSDFTRNEIDEYREKFLQFGNKVNGTSAPAEDPVDRMNMIALQGGIKAEGQTIADFYDNLLLPKSVSPFKSFPKATCVDPPTFDPSSGVPQAYYTNNANNGSYIMRDNWMYSGENPNNGGMLYDGIFADDQELNYASRMI